MYELLLQEFQQFVAEIRGLTFKDIQEKFVVRNGNNPIGKFTSQYVPKLYEYQQDFDQHKREQQKFRKTPTLNGKLQFQNMDNLHRKVMTIFRSFLLSEMKDLRKFLELTMDIDQLSNMLSRIQTLRYKSIEFNLIHYIFTASKRSIRIYMKLREQISKESSFDKNKFLGISTHNPAKYADKYHYLDKVVLSRRKKDWQQLINLVGFEYDDEFTQIIFGSRDEILAVQLIQYCLWINKRVGNLSPTK